VSSTYRAVEISSPGVFRLVERAAPVPGPGQVRIRVEACGVCHSDPAGKMRPPRKSSGGMCGVFWRNKFLRLNV